MALFAARYQQEGETMVFEPQESLKRKMAKNGHEISNHSWTHKNAKRLSRQGADCHGGYADWDRRDAGCRIV